MPPNSGHFKEGENNPMFGRTGETNPMFGKPKPEGAGSPATKFQFLIKKLMKRLLTILLIQLLESAQLRFRAGPDINISVISLYLKKTKNRQNAYKDRYIF
jgi:hypothetical protein